ncbi:MupA/Atu3671 family FMN-dependent luciferase-like monooxygenase [Bosea sp. 124]|uniref:MupA/Atu3671 family FMN-dependent luciferase-like monooxygenase n=1 Tax=Bosea sp. 124 TaxID=2135642 RepID=UPI000D33E345|nr:MupA/Atu3671 family FMN-dependent luciferase-like monooxygenase [Bosea sp. 124]PTM41487.1 natural product biosynthesis luciferase-like monooxygenase protein [Bosea sp. 124]
MLKMTSVLMGEESLLVQCAEILVGRGHGIQAIVSSSVSVRKWAEERKITVVEPDHGYESVLSQLDYDWFFSASNLRMVPDGVWKRARHGAANFHDGPLPRYAGLNAPTWALLAGETQYGITWHSMVEAVDEGDILVQITFDVDEHDTALTLNTKCFEAGIDGFLSLVQQIESGSLAPRAQSLSERTYFPKFRLPEAAATLQFDATTDQAERLFRALDYGSGYRNPLAFTKVLIAGKAYNIGRLTRDDSVAGAVPGQVVEISDGSAVIATRDAAVRIADLTDEYGTTVEISSVLSRGQNLAAIEPSLATDLTTLSIGLARCDAYFRRQLRSLQDLDLPWFDRSADLAPAGRKSLPVATPSGLATSAVAIAFLAYLSRVASQDAFGIAYGNDELQGRAARFPGYVVPTMPFVARFLEKDTVASLVERADAEFATLRAKLGQSGDLIVRNPDLTATRLSVGLYEGASGDNLLGFESSILILALSPGNKGTLIYDPARISAAGMESLAAGFAAFLAEFAADGSRAIAELAMLGEAERRLVLFDHNRSERDYDREICVHQLIEQAVDRTPDAIALCCDDEEISFAELDRRANKVAHELIRLGVRPGALVGLFLPRSLELVIGAFAIHKAGAAYVPLDPAYPADRTTMMAQDSDLSAIIFNQESLHAIPHCDAQRLDIDAVINGGSPIERPHLSIASSELAYVIYTSGSTGRPKGVMIEHRNVVNFFVGMDERIRRDDRQQPVWLAVTSLSFDISVLELFWTLARGFKVVINMDASHRRALPKKRAAGAMDFSLFYWGNDDGAGRLKYQLLLDGARFADTHGFKAVWTPERHFHAFGGPYPNPAVTGAAVAAVTRNLEVRAGSCVLPLHPPARVAEEWAVVDNLSDGRVGLAFASGWMPEDFILRPENAPPNNKAALFRDIEVVRKLWRGEAVPFDMAGGKTIQIVTQPRPVQPELPVWVTTAGNPETYREAARVGAHVLTHLLGQSIDELAGKITIYRDTLRECGHNPDDFTVTLMLHTLVGEDREQVRELAREPMKAYLRSAAALIKQYAWAFPAFKKPQGVTAPLDIDLQSLDADEMDAILEFAFLRYFDDSGLFGTVEDALARVAALKAIGVNEVACLIDYGVASSTVMEGLSPLADVVARANESAPAQVEPERDLGLAGLIRHHRVTHMQATPSMMTMIMMNDEDREALSSVQHLFIGGEALHGSLLRQINQVTKASVENMYGPTETTIWSSTQRAAPTDGVVPLGQPIANTQLYVLDRHQSPVPVGCPGELFIGGDGVARGYLKNAGLTQERFVENPFVPGQRMYRTGDLVRRDPGGTLSFIGRADHQVKVRGYRIELGEIEAQLGQVAGVLEAVAMAREDQPNDVRLVAYLRFAGEPVPDAKLRVHLAATLPEFMIPAHFVAMAAFPLTPNAKVDRKALPRPDEARRAQAPTPSPAVELSGDLEPAIADAFKQFLGLERVSTGDNFFKLGGHSLLAVQMHRHLKATLAPSLTITDLFRFPTVAGLAEHLKGSSKASDQLGRVADRAAMRRNAMNRGSLRS